MKSKAFATQAVVHLARNNEIAAGEFRVSARGHESEGHLLNPLVHSPTSLYLGNSNTIRADRFDVGVGGYNNDHAHGWVGFSEDARKQGATFVLQGISDEMVKTINIGVSRNGLTRDTEGLPGAVAQYGTLDLTGGVSEVQAKLLRIGYAASRKYSASGKLLMSAGTFRAGTAIVGGGFATEEGFGEGLLEISGGTFTSGTAYVALQTRMTPSSGMGITRGIINLSGSAHLVADKIVMAETRNKNSKNTHAMEAELNLSGNASATVAQGIIMGLHGSEENGAALTTTISITGGTLSVNGDITKGAVIGTAGSSATVKVKGGRLEMNGHRLNVDQALTEGGTVSNLGGMGNGGGLVKTSPAVLTLEGVNRYAGTTRVEAGTVELLGVLEQGNVSVSRGAQWVQQPGAVLTMKVHNAMWADRFTVAPGGGATFCGHLVVHLGSAVGTGRWSLFEGTAPGSFEGVQTVSVSGEMSAILEKRSSTEWSVATRQHRMTFNTETGEFVIEAKTVPIFALLPGFALMLGGGSLLLLRRPAAIAAGLLALVCSNAGALTLNNKRDELHLIRVGKKADERTIKAALALSKKLKEIFGKPFPVTKAPGDDGILLGTIEEFEGEADPVLKEASPGISEAYRIDATGRALRLVGASSLGVQNAVWGLLHEMGYRHYFPTAKWEIIPRLETFALKAPITGRPDFYTRRFFINDYTWNECAEDFAVWMRHNRLDYGFQLNSHHVYQDIVQRYREVFKQHPEYLSAKGMKFKIANEGLRKLVVDDVLAQAAATKMPPHSISLEPSDEGGWEASPLGSVSDQVVLLANEAAAALRAAGYNTKVGILAYYQHSPPPTIEVDRDVIVSVANGFIMQGYTFDEVVAGWKEKGATLGVYEYYCIAPWSLDLPGRGRATDAAAVARMIRKMYNQGIRYATVQMDYAFGPCGLGYYVATRCFWNHGEADQMEAIRKEFLDKCFGPAAPAMEQFYAQIDGANRPLLSGHLLHEMYAALQTAYRMTDESRNPPGREDYLDRVERGVAAYEWLTVPPRSYSRNLVPCNSQSETESEAGKRHLSFPAGGSGQIVLYTWLPKENDRIAFDVRGGIAYGDRGPVRVAVYPAQEPEGKAVRYVEVKPDKQWHGVNIKSPSWGLHRVEIRTVADTTAIRWPNSLRLTIPLVRENDLLLDLQGLWSFYVPKDSEVVTGYKATYEGRIVAGDKTEMLAFQKIPNGFFKIDVPSGKSGAVWQLEGPGSGRFLFHNIPSYVAPSPWALLVPEEVLQ